MPNTPGGVPYPDPSEPVAQGAANMEALATFLDPALAVASRSATMNMTTNIWSPVATWAQTKLIGTGLTVTSAGIAVAFTGRVRVDAAGVMSTGGGYRRGITVSPTGGVTAAAVTPVVPPVGGGNPHSLAFGFEMDVTSGQTLTSYGYQDSGGNLTMASNTITVRRIP